MLNMALTTLNETLRRHFHAELSQLCHILLVLYPGEDERWQFLDC